jgi:hypothetical protein
MKGPRFEENHWITHIASLDLSNVVFQTKELELTANRLISGKKNCFYDSTTYLIINQQLSITSDLYMLSIIYFFYEILSVFFIFSKFKNKFIMKNERNIKENIY